MTGFCLRNSLWEVNPKASKAMPSSGREAGSGTGPKKSSPEKTPPLTGRLAVMEISVLTVKKKYGHDFSSGGVFGLQVWGNSKFWGRPVPNEPTDPKKLLFESKKLWVNGNPLPTPPIRVTSSRPCPRSDTKSNVKEISSP